MTHETFRKAIAEALDPEYAAMIPEHGEHVFSDKFERRMQKLIRRRRKPYYVLISTGLRRAACIVVMFLVVSFTTVMSVEALRKPFLDFLASIFGDHTTIESVLDLDGDYPETFEERYEITEGLEGFILESEETVNDSIFLYYRSRQDNSIIIFAQKPVKNYTNNLNTENTSISNHLIGDNSAITFYDNQGYYNIVWNNGKYIFELYSTISKDVLINIANSVKKVE